MLGVKGFAAAIRTQDVSFFFHMAKKIFILASLADFFSLRDIVLTD